MKKALAIDVGGTKIYSTVINENGEIIGDIEKYSTPKVYSEIISTFKNIISKHENEIDVVAFSTCGAVNNQNTGILGSTGNIAKEYPTTDFQSLSSKPVFVENDANCAAWAEYEIGSAKGCLNSVMLTLGTGVGGGIIVNGQLLKGKNGAAGEMHFAMSRNQKRKCTCGAWDCFEAYASGNGLRQTGIEIFQDENITTYDIIERVSNNDEKALLTLKTWQNDIALGILGLNNIFDTDCVVLSGSMEKFVNTNEIEKFVNENIVTTKTKIFHAKAGNYAGMIGVVLLANESI